MRENKGLLGILRKSFDLIFPEHQHVRDKILYDRLKYIYICVNLMFFILKYMILKYVSVLTLHIILYYICRRAATQITRRRALVLLSIHSYAFYSI